MNRFGGKITQANIWQLAVPANASRTEATVQSKAFFRDAKFDPDGINSGPVLHVWPFDTDPTTLTPQETERDSLICAKPGDSITVTGAASKAAIFVLCSQGSARYAATEY